MTVCARVCARVRARSESGRAIIEVAFAAVLLLVPTVYILIGVLRVQAATLAVTQAARDVGRLVETSVGLPSLEQARAVAAVALTDQHIATETLRIVTTGPGGSCVEATAAAFSREPGMDYDICVVTVLDLPGVPTVLTGSRNTVTGVYSVHIDPVREGGPP